MSISTGPATSDTIPASTVGVEDPPEIPMLPPIPCASASVIQTLDSYGETSYTTPGDEQLPRAKVTAVQDHVEVPSMPASHVQEMPSRLSTVSVHVQQMPARQSGGPSLPAGPAMGYKP